MLPVLPAAAGLWHGLQLRLEVSHGDVLPQFMPSNLAGSVDHLNRRHHPTWHRDADLCHITINDLGDFALECVPLNVIPDKRVRCDADRAHTFPLTLD